MLVVVSCMAPSGRCGVAVEQCQHRLYIGIADGMSICAGMGVPTASERRSFWVPARPYPRKWTCRRRRCRYRADIVVRRMASFGHRGVEGLAQLSRRSPRNATVATVGRFFGATTGQVGTLGGVRGRGELPTHSRPTKAPNARAPHPLATHTTHSPPMTYAHHSSSRPHATAHPPHTAPSSQIPSIALQITEVTKFARLSQTV